jgi:hypothetical protein|tara:strand:- start:1082 stop:1216 length:135 start_codon:yes stop_codon:yes gene_type:complete
MKNRSTMELIGRYFIELEVWRLLLCGIRHTATPPDPISAAIDRL